MTDYISRADAIDAVRGLSVLVDDEDFAYFEDALKGVPSAELPKGDLISRAEVLSLFPNAFYDGLASQIKALPSADAVYGRWNTGKPTKGGKYIVTLIGLGDYRFVDIMHYDKPCMPNREVSGECWYRDDDEWGDVVYDDKDIIAWIPLPTPYKGGDSE